MGTKFGLYPEASASHSKIELLDWCQRQYRHATYTSWRGWEQDAPEEARTAYALKQLTTLHGVLGTAIHEEAKRFAEAARDGRDLPGAEEVRERVHAAIEGAIQSSADIPGFLRRPKKQIMLRSAYYRGGTPDPREVTTVRDRVDRCVEGLCSHPFWAEVAKFESAEIRALDSLTSFTFEGVKIYVKADFIAHAPAVGDVLLVDYKSGSGDMLVRPQLALYALYAERELRIEFRQGYWEARGINFFTRETLSYTLTRVHLVEAENRLRLAIARMRSLLDNVHINKPLPMEEFLLANPAQRGHCIHQCPYYQLCKPHLHGGAGTGQRMAMAMDADE